MGAWGGGLYQDDEACDLRDTIKVLARLPWPGDKLLPLLLNADYSQDTKEADGSMFWLVAADQFERRGVACQQVFDTAIQIINSGQDITNLRDLEMPERDLKKRENELQKLRARLENPRPERKIPANPRPPALVVEAGEIYAFPAMQGYQDSNNIARSFNAWFSHWDEGHSQHFLPDSWGAFVVLAIGREHDWLPWAACCPLFAPLDHKVSMEEAVCAYLNLNPEWNFHICEPKALHLKRMQAQCIGTLPLDMAKIAALLPSASTINEQVAIGRSFCSAAYNVVNPSKAYYTLRLADLVEKA